MNLWVRSSRANIESEEERTATRHRRTDWFLPVLVMIVVVGLVVRLGAVSMTDPPRLISDATYFRVQGLLLTQGHGFVEPFVWTLQHRLVASAFHPPLFSVVLGGVAWLGFESVGAARVAACFLGSVTILMVGILGRSVGGRRVGLVAAAIAALNPNLWVPDGALASEALAALLVATALVLAYALARRPRFLVATGLGVALGLAGLTRPETLLLSVILVGPLVASMELPTRRRIEFFVVTSVVTALVIGPWVVRTATVFERPVLISANGQAVLGYANCPATYDGNWLGSWRIDCPAQTLEFAPKPSPANPDEAELAHGHGIQGVEYAKRHVVTLATKVIPARIGRTWSLYHPFDFSDAKTNESKPRSAALLSVLFLWASMVATVGGVLLRRLKLARVWPLLTPLFTVTLVSALAYGTPRFRVIAEPSIAVLAALGVVGVADWLRRVRTSPPPSNSDAVAASDGSTTRC